jgi:tetratricopeptide (TPR) repeat protein
MRTIKLKFLIIALAFTFALPIVASSQTIRDAIEAYNTGATMINEDPAGALEHLYRALEISEDLEFEGKETKELAESLIPRAHWQLAMNLYREKKMYETLDQLEKAQETSKKYGDRATLGRVDRIIPQLYNQMGNNEYRSNNFEKAIDYYKKAIGVKADYPDPYLGISLSYEKQEDFNNMLEYLKKTIEVSNQTNDRTKADDALRKAKGFLLRNADEAQKAKKYQEAIEWFTQSLEFDNNDGSVFFVLAVNYGELKQWDKVIEFSLLALENANGSLDQAGIHYQMGTAYQNLGKNAEACKSFSNALSGSYRAAAEYQMKEILKCQ